MKNLVNFVVNDFRKKMNRTIRFNKKSKEFKRRYMRYYFSVYEAIPGIKGILARFLMIRLPLESIRGFITGLVTVPAVLFFMMAVTPQDTDVNAAGPYESGYIQEDTYEVDKAGNKVYFMGNNSRVYYMPSTEDYVKTADGYYIQLKFLGDTRKETTDYDIPAYGGKKSWMPYDLFGSGTNQYKLQQLAETDENGLRTVNGRYCVAVGSAFGTEIGQKFDLILENGCVVPCVMGDQKSDYDTDGSNIFTMNGCCSEFIVDDATLNEAAMTSGDISSIYKRWNAPVKKIAVYDESAFDSEETIMATND